MDFEQLYTTYFRKVYGFALSLSRNAHMAEEITQETFYRVLRNPDAFEGRSSVDTYLCSIAHHQYVSMLRSQKHIDFRTDTAQLSAPGGMEEALADRDTARQLYIHRNTLVYRLDKVQRQIGLNLRSFDDAVTFKMLLEMKKCAANKAKKTL